jgi:flagellar basal-body rod protein FlgB
MNVIDPATLMLTQRALDAASLRHAAHAQNIANANVAGAQAVRVGFEEHLEGIRTSLESGKPLTVSDVESVRPSMDSLSGTARINLDSEMASLSRNSLHYQSLVRALERHLSILTLAVTDGKR